MQKCETKRNEILKYVLHITVHKIVNKILSSIMLTKNGNTVM
jgi:hypothetical protein